MLTLFTLKIRRLIMKKIVLLSSLLSGLLLADGFEYKGNIGSESTYANHDIDGKRETQNALRLELELKQKTKSGQVVFSGLGIVDIDDKKRRYLNVKDLYYKHEFENSDLLIGRNTRFWGALEFYNHTDTFNTKDWRDDPFDYDAKIGANNIAYTHYFDDSEFSVIAKVHEEQQRVQDIESVSNFIPSIYSDKLETQKDRDRPTLYLKYSGSGEDTQIDYSLIYQNGYDEQRYITPVGAELRQHAYLVDKVMGYATLVSGSTIYKTELAYTKSDDEKVSDYAQMSLGVEHTLYSVVGKSDIGLLAEYYNYKEYDEKKLGAKEFGNLFANDVVVGFRYSFNDSADSDILGGVAVDRDNHEKIISLEYNTRLYEKYKLGLSYLHLSSEEGSLFKELDSVKLDVGYYF
jgi:hypothetical protein